MPNFQALNSPRRPACSTGCPVYCSNRTAIPSWETWLAADRARAIWVEEDGKMSWISWDTHPICSMYSIFTYIWVIYGGHVGKYSIHGAYGHGIWMWFILLKIIQSKLVELVAGFSPPLWKMMDFVNWDDNRNPILMGKWEKWQPVTTNQ